MPSDLPMWAQVLVAIFCVALALPIAFVWRSLLNECDRKAEKRAESDREMARRLDALDDAIGGADDA